MLTLANQEMQMHGMASTRCMPCRASMKRKISAGSSSEKFIRDMPQLERAILWTPTGKGEVKKIISHCSFQPRIQAFTKLITLCGRAGDAAKAQEVFDCMRDFDPEKVSPNTYTYSALIFALGNGGMWEKALETFEEMKLAAMENPKCQPSLISYSSAIAACEKGSRPDIAIRLFQDMIQEGIRPDRVVFLSILDVCIQGNEWSHAEEMLDTMHSHGYAASSRIYQFFFEKMAAERKTRESLDMFLTLQMLGLDPTPGMCGALLHCFGNDGRPDLAQQLWQSMKRAGIELTAVGQSLHWSKMLHRASWSYNC